MNDEVLLAKLKKRNHSLKMQTRNLQRQIKSLIESRSRIERYFLEVARCNCSGVQREAETYKEVLFRALSRLADDGTVGGTIDRKYLNAEIMEKAAELKQLMMRTSIVKCHYDKAATNAKISEEES